MRKVFAIFTLFFLCTISLFSSEYYWDSPRSITETDSRFPITVTNGKDSYVFWEEVNLSKKQIYITGRRYDSVNNYTDIKRFAGPFSYFGNEVPDIYTAAINKKGTVSIAVLSAPSQISIFTTKNKGIKFYETKLKTNGIMVAPRIYTTHDDKFKLFTSVGESEAFTVYSADSDNGLFWMKFSQFYPTSSYIMPFIPVLDSLNGKDLVVFQAQYKNPENNRSSYQLFMTYKNGSSWTPPVLITNEKSINSKKKAFYKYENQRPYLYNFHGKMYISWERTESENSDIWAAEIDENGIKEGTARQVSFQGNASRGILFSFNDRLCCSWFDTRSGQEAIYMAEKKGVNWGEEVTLVENENSNLFSHPLILDYNGEDVLTFLWQQKTPDNHNTIAMLTRDVYVDSPVLKAVNFTKGKESKEEDIQVQVVFPKDASEIYGYSYTWGKDRNALPDKNKKFSVKNNTLNLNAADEGEYFLSVRIVDGAGNWSEPVELSYYRDLTPPLPPELNINNVDEFGFLASNTYKLNWEPSLSEDAVSYIYKIEHLGSVPKSLLTSSRHPSLLSQDETIEEKNKLFEKYSRKVNNRKDIKNGTETSNLFTRDFYNAGNGVYLLSVSSVDNVGNVSEPSTGIFALNKFEPSTYITGIELEERSIGKFGNIIFAIYGGGFTYDGVISEIYIDSDGKAPYDFVLKKDKFKTVSNWKITNINIGDNIDKGSYKIGLNHTDRGIYFSKKNILNVDENGTVKIEADFVKSSRVTSDFQHFMYIVANNAVILVLLIIFILLIIIFVITSVGYTIYENKINRLEVQSLIKGVKMPLLKKNNKIRNGYLPSLKIKLVSFTFLIIIVVVAVITVKNGHESIQSQAKTMASGLKTETEVLLESLCSGVKNFFPTNDVLELSALPKQKDAMVEVSSVTIIGQKKGDFSSENLNYIWATNDTELNIGSSYGEIEIKDEDVNAITEEFKKLDKEIAESEKVKTLSGEIEKNTRDASELFSTGLRENFIKAEELSNDGKNKRDQLDAILADYSKNRMGSKPYFDINKLDFEQTDYIFYKPVIYRQGTSNNYVHSIVYLKLSTKTLIDRIDAERTRIIKLGLITAIIAVVIGIVGSYLFASFTVRPIKKLEAHVTIVGQTKNKLNLKGKDVNIKSKDEVGRLGNAINIMTRELVLNAEEEELAMDGKAVQKAFLPLADSGVNMKNTIAEYEDDNLQIYGYYEGESGVSGDYFDYKKLDNEWFGIIKCDASGHGIPAAIIMTVVATIFRRYFENWSFKKNGTKLNILVEQINDFIEGLGLKGKFATLIICLLNIRTGELYMCNAGDNLVHIFDGVTRKIKVITLKSVPTAGVFTSDLVSMRGGFAVEKTILNKGDTLFLYTDGIEESTRRIREKDYSVRQNEIEVKKFNPKTRTEEVQVKFEDAKEEFGPERVAEIIESVYNKQKYILEKEDNPNSSETLEFNFEKCEGSVKETILALASLEKVYRLYKPNNIQPTDYIKIDKKIDEFLSKYFNMYSYYAANKTKAVETSNYIDYDLMLEDEQSDDLTLLAIKRI